MALKIFKENQYSTFHCAFRVGIQGADVTSYVMDDSITVRYSDRGGPNTVSFSLQNAYDNFVLTEENLGWDSKKQTANPQQGKWRGSFLTGDQPHYSEKPKQIIYEYKEYINLRTTNSVESSDDIKIPTYEFKPGTIVFNKNDPVRIFIHNPLTELLGGEAGEWIPFFTGFIDNKPVTTDYINGESKINITASCIKKQLQMMRLTFTPIVEYSGDMINELLYDTADAGFYRDLIWQDNQGIYQHPFTDKNFHDSISILLLGDQNLPEGQQRNRSRVGFVTRGTTVRGVDPNALDISVYDPNTKAELPEKRLRGGFNMEAWHELLMFGNRHNTAFSPDSTPYYTTNEVTEILARTVTYDTEYSPWAARLHMLLPPTNVELTRLMDENVKEVRQRREWLQTRYDVILQLCNLLDFQFLTTPMGDIVFEYPMYDYVPYDYGPSWENCFIIDKFAQKDTLDTEAGDIISGLIATAGIDTFVGQGTDQVIEGYFNKVIIKSDVLAGKYGARYESWEAPIGRQAEKGVSMDNLRIAALIEFQRRLADVDRATLSFAFHPFLFPNRNIMWTKKNKLAWISSVEYSINLFKDIQCNVDVSYVRDYTLIESDSGFALDYRYIFGGAQMPLSYKDIQTASSVETRLKGNQGVHVLYEPNQTEKSQSIEEQVNDISKDTRGDR